MGNQYISECQIITNNVAVTGSFTAGCYLGTVVRSVAGKSGNVNLSYTDIAGAPQAGTTVQGLGVTGSPGTSTTGYARVDHVHPACIQTSPQTTDFGLGLATTEYVKNQAHLIDATILASNPSGGKSGSDKYTGPGQYLFALGQHQHPSDTTKLNVSGGSLTGNVSGTGAFFNYISASQFAGDGSLLTNLVSQDVTKLPLAGGTLTGGLTGTTARFNSLSGDGSLLYNVFGTDTSKIPIAGGTFTGSITGTTACFTDLCATRLFGDGSGLTNLLKPNEQLKFDSINISDSPSNGQQVGYRTGTPQNESLNVGYQACSTGICSTVIGNSAIGGIGASVLGLAASAGTCSVAVGFSSKASNSAGSTAIGACASVSSGPTASESVAIGFSSCAGTNATSVGSKADARNCGVAVGQGANAGVLGGTAIGTQTQACNTGTAVGCVANAVNQGASVGAISCGSDKGAAVGYNAIACNGGVAVGYTAYSPISGVAIGCCANAGETGNVAIGTGAKATSLDVAIGNFASANTNATALGDLANASNDSIAIGKNSTASNNSIAIGNNTTTLNNQIVIGSTNSLAADKANLTIIGNNINSSGECSVNIGYNITSNDSATVIGIKSSASPCSVVIGDDSCSVMLKTVDSGPSIVVGNKIIAKEASVAVGYNNLVQDESIGIGSHIVSTSRSFAGGDCACASGNSIGIGYCVDAEVCSLSLGNCSYACDRSTAAGYGAIAAIGSTSIGCGAWSRCFSTVIGIHSGAVTYGSIGIGPDAKIRGFCIKDICSAIDFANFPHAYVLAKTTSLSPVVCDVGLGYATCPQLYIPGANVSGCGIPPDTVICTVTIDPAIKCKVRLTLSNVVQAPGSSFTSNTNLLKITHPYVCYQDAEMTCGCNILTVSSTAPEDEKGVYRRLFNANADLTACDTYGSSSCRRIDGFYGGHIHCGRLPGCGDLYSNAPETFPSYTNVRCALYDGWGSAVLIEENTPGEGSLRRVNLSTGLNTKYFCNAVCQVTPACLNSNNWFTSGRQRLLDGRYSYTTDGRYLYVADAITHTLGFIDLTDQFPGYSCKSGNLINNNLYNNNFSFPSAVLKDGQYIKAYGNIATGNNVTFDREIFDLGNDQLLAQNSNGVWRVENNPTSYCTLKTTDLYSKDNFKFLEETSLNKCGLVSTLDYAKYVKPSSNTSKFAYDIQPLTPVNFLVQSTGTRSRDLGVTAYKTTVIDSYSFSVLNGSGVPNDPGGPYFFIQPLSGGKLSLNYSTVGTPTSTTEVNSINFGSVGTLFNYTHPFNSTADKTLAETLLLSSVRFNEPRFIQYVYDEGTKERSLYVINTGKKIYIDGKSYETDGSFGPAFGFLIFKIKLGPARETGSKDYFTPVSALPFATGVTPIASLSRIVSGTNASTNLQYYKSITDITGMTVDPKGNIFVSVKTRDTRLEGFSAVRFYDAYNNTNNTHLSDFIIKIPNTESLWHNGHSFSTSKSAVAINNGTKYPTFRFPQHLALDNEDNLLIVDSMVNDDYATTKSPYTTLPDILVPKTSYPQAFWTRIRKITPDGKVSTLQTLGPSKDYKTLDVLDGPATVTTTQAYFSTLSSVRLQSTGLAGLSGVNVGGYGIAFNPTNNHIFVSCRFNASIQLLVPTATKNVYLQYRFAGNPNTFYPNQLPSGESANKHEALITPSLTGRNFHKFQCPFGLCLDHTGKSVLNKVTNTSYDNTNTVPYLYVADSNDNTIKRINAKDPTVSGGGEEVVVIAGGTNPVENERTVIHPISNKSYKFYTGPKNLSTTPSLTAINPYKTWEAGLTNTETVLNVTSKVGVNALLNAPAALALSDNGQYLYVSDTGNSNIRRITLWERDTSNKLIPLVMSDTTTKTVSSYATVRVVAGPSDNSITTKTGYQDGNGSQARFQNLGQIAVDEIPNSSGGIDTYLYVADGNFNEATAKIRKIKIPHGWDGNQNQVEVSTFIGENNGGYYPSRFGVPGIRKALYGPRGLVKDRNKNFYVSETFNSTIRKISPEGLVINYAGVGTKVDTNSPTNEATSPNLITVVWPIVDSNREQSIAAAGDFTLYDDNAALTVSSSTENPAVYKNVNKDWRSFLAGNFAGIRANSTDSYRLSSIYNDNFVKEVSATSSPVLTNSLTGTFLSNISYMTYRSADQSSAADQIFVLTTSPALSTTNLVGGSTEFWFLNQIPTSNPAASGIWSTATKNQGRLKGCLMSISVDEKNVSNGINTHTGIVNNSTLIDSTMGYYASFSNPVALLPHYKLTSYPETITGDALKFPFSNSLTIIDSSKDGSRSVIRKKITNFTASDTVYNNVTYSFGPIQTIFGNVYEATSKPGTTSGITGIMDGLVYTNSDGTPKYPYENYVVTNTGKTYNNIYFSDTRHNVILKYNILTKSISAIGVAGLPDEESNPPYIDPVYMLAPSIGIGSLAKNGGILGQTYMTFNRPKGLALSLDQNQLFIADYGNHLIKRITDLEKTSPILTTIAGRISAVQFNNGTGSLTRIISFSGREMGAALSGTFEFPNKLYLNSFSTNANNISAHPFGTYINRLSGLVTGPFVADNRFRTLEPGRLLYIADREIIRKLYLNADTTLSTLSCVGNLSAAGLTAQNVVFANPGSPYNNSHLSAIYPRSDYLNSVNPIIDITADNFGTIFYARRFSDGIAMYTVDPQEQKATFTFSPSSLNGSAQIKAIQSDGAGSKIFIAGSYGNIETRTNYQAVWEFITADGSITNLFELARAQGQKTYPGANAYTQLAYDISLDKAIAGDKYLHMLNYDYSSPSSQTRDTLYFSTYKLTDGFDLKVGMSAELYAATYNNSVIPSEMTGNLLPQFTYITAILDENRLVLSKPLSANSKTGQNANKIVAQYTSTGTQRLTAKFQRIDYRVLLPITIENGSNNITIPTAGLRKDADTSLLKVGDYLIDIFEPSSLVSSDGILIESPVSVVNKYYVPFVENDKTEGMGKLHPRTIVEIPTGAGSSFKLSQRASFSPSIGSNQATVMGLFYPGPGIAIGRNASTTLNSSLALGSPSQPLALNAPVPNQPIPAPARFVRVTVNGLDYMMPLYNIPDGL